MSDEVWTTLIATGGTVVVAYITQVVAKRVIATRKSKRQLEVGENEAEAVDRYTNDPGQFVRDVLRSNEQLTKRVEAAEDKADRVERAFEAFRDKDRKFRNALARWFVDIMAAFEQNNIDMPYPREGDQDILSDVIPSALEATQPRRPYRPKT